MSVYILSTSERITLFWQRFLSGIGFYIPHFWTAFFTPTFHSLFDRRLQNLLMKGDGQFSIDRLRYITDEESTSYEFHCLLEKVPTK